MTPPPDSLEAALRAVPMLTWTGEVKTADGDWIGPVTLELPDYPALAAKALEWIREKLALRLGPDEAVMTADVARRLGL